MNIRLAYDFCFDAYRSLFPEIQMFDWNTDVHHKIDLLIFPGGSDMSPSYYTADEELAKIDNMCSYDSERDAIEYDIFYGSFSGRIEVDKILGICRGLQFLNVMYNGRLFPDLGIFTGSRHPGIHEIKHVRKNSLDFMINVNSMHHQGISILGRYRLDGFSANPRILAVNPADNLPEIVCWENGRVLGVQFHPEFYSDNNPDKREFAEFCRSWIKNEITIE